MPFFSSLYISTTFSNVNPISFNPPVNSKAGVSSIVLPLTYYRDTLAGLAFCSPNVKYPVASKETMVQDKL